MKQLRYSCKLILWRSKVNFTFAAAHILFRNSKVLTLPHPSYLRKYVNLGNNVSDSCESLKIVDKQTEIINAFQLCCGKY